MASSGYINAVGLHGVSSDELCDCDTWTYERLDLRWAIGGGR